MKKFYLHTKVAIVFLFSLFPFSNSTAQSTPASQALQYNQTFTIASTTTVFPVGWQGWLVGTAATNAFRTTAPTANSNLIASSTAANATGGLHNYNGKIGILSSAIIDPVLGLAINTTGKFNVQVRFDAMTIRNPFDGASNTMINAIDLQYRVGSISGAWTSATGSGNGFYQNNTITQTGAVTTPQNQIAQIIN